MSTTRPLATRRSRGRGAAVILTAVLAIAPAAVQAQAALKIPRTSLSRKSLALRQHPPCEGFLYATKAAPTDLAKTLGALLGVDAGGTDSIVLPCVK